MAFEVEVFVRALSGPPQVGDGEGKSGVAEGIGGRQVDLLVVGTFRRLVTVEIGRSPRCQREAGDAKSEGRLETCSRLIEPPPKIRTQKVPLYGKCGSAIVFLSHDACKRGEKQ